MKIEEKQLPKGWEVKKLGEVCQINPKLPNKDQINSELEVQFLPMKLVEEVVNKISLTETRTFFEVQKRNYTPFINEDIIFAKVTPCMENGKIAVVKNLKNGIGFGSSEFHVVRCLESILSKFVFYFLVRDKFRNEAAREMTGAVGLRRVPKQFIENYSINLPPLPEQQAIVAKIEELFVELENGKQELLTAQAKLKTYRQSLLKSAFEGRLTNENLKDGELPKDWEVRKLGEVCKLKNGFAFKSDNYQENGVPVIRISDINSGVVSSEDAVRVEARDDYENYLVETDDILVAMSGATTGKFGIFKSTEKAYQNQRVGKFKILDKKILNNQFLFYQINSLKKQIEKDSYGGAQPNISSVKIEQMKIILPPLSEQQSIVAILESKLTICDKIEETITASLKQAEILRQSILKKAFEGELIKKTQK